jgi:hypothetical protein
MGLLLSSTNHILLKKGKRDACLFFFLFLFNSRKKNLKQCCGRLQIFRRRCTSVWLWSKFIAQNVTKLFVLFFFVFLKYICYSYFQFLAFPYGDVQSENFDPTQHIQKKKMKINKKR